MFNQVFEDFSIVRGGVEAGRLGGGEVNGWHMTRLVTFARRRQVEDDWGLTVPQLTVDLNVLDAAIKRSGKNKHSEAFSLVITVIACQEALIGSGC